MNKRKLKLLERAYDNEILGAMMKIHPLLQSRSKDAQELERSGHLVKVTRRLGSLTAEGYVLTNLGRYAWCARCTIM